MKFFIAGLIGTALVLVAVCITIALAMAYAAGRLFRIPARLAALIGVPQQTITYYEVRGVSPPPELLVAIADALDVSTDILLGRKKAPERSGGAAPATSVQRQKHLKRLDELPPHDQKAVFKIIDALAERRAKSRGA